MRQRLEPCIHKATIAKSQQKLAEARKDFSLKPLEGLWLCDILILVSWLSEL